MTVTIVLAGLLLAQAGTATLDTTEQRDVAFQEVVSGANQAAIAQLEAQRAANPQDPALLINLGTAYAAIGDYARAQDCYSTAATSRERYDLELANGEWVDSRRAARDALAALQARNPAL